MSKDEGSWSDSHLVREALRGNEEAWVLLIDRYKNLIFSIAVRYGLSRDDAVDVFQSVVAELLSGLAGLRQPQALQAWLMQVAAHKCLEVMRQRRREDVTEDWDAAEQRSIGESPALADSLIEEVQSGQILRRAMQALSPQCRQMVRMLFYETPPRSYAEVAQALGIAVGSIGLTRRRCLERLRKLLDEAGYE
jgi:RNA polymerase sigma factor (sigma-70 family)